MSIRCGLLLTWPPHFFWSVSLLKIEKIFLLCFAVLSANEVADEMLAKIDTSQSFVLVLCGLSGTGKGTTVEVLKKKLAGKKKKVTTWSNGNIFRSVTYLAATYCIQNDRHNFDPDFCLTPGNLRNFMSMMSFAKQVRNRLMMSASVGMQCKLPTYVVKNAAHTKSPPPGRKTASSIPGSMDWGSICSL